MGRVVLAWAFGSIFFQVSAGAIYAAFARQLGAGEATFGFLAGVFPLMSFFQLFAARMLEKTHRPKAMMMGAGLFCRLLWVFAAALPLLHRLAPEIMRREWMLPVFVACILFSSVGQAFTSPSFFSWMSAIVPDRIGPVFWARRQQIGTWVAIGAVLVANFLADQAGWFAEISNGVFPPLMLYSVLLTLAALCGVADIALFRKIPEAPATVQAAQEKAEVAPLAASTFAPLKERAVRNYLWFVAFSVAGFATTGPLLWLHCLEVLDFDKTRTGLILSIAPLVGVALTSKFWGNAIKTYGSRPILRFASLILVLMPLFWLFSTPKSWVLLMVVVGLSGVLAAAYQICNFNFITRACPHLPRPTLTALFSIAAGTVFALCAWLSGIVAQSLSGWHFSLWGFTFVNYHIVFAFSLVPRLINAYIIAPRLEEPAASGTLEAIGEIKAELLESWLDRFSRPFSGR